MPALDDKAISANDPQADAPARLPYRAPVLRKLGSIRELTLGGTMGAFVEGVLGKKVMLM